MLERPDLPDEKIIACLQADYGLPVVRVAFLPLGVDVNAAVYRAVTVDETPYFVKVRRGGFDAVTVALPKFLSGQGLAPVIAPLAAKTGQLWASLEPFTLVLYPFVEGHNGYEVELSDRHWGELGAALKRLHTVDVPPALAQRIPVETYSPRWRETAKMFLARVEQDVFDEPVAAKLAAFLKTRRGEILDLVERAEQLAQALQARAPEMVVCHADIHAGNVLIDARDAFYIVDWDNPIRAPKERDLMFIGGGQFGARRTPREEETLFYRTYGPTLVDPAALAYYRYERIVADLAAYCEQLFLTEAGGGDRPQAFQYLASNFLPNNTLEIAYQSDRTRRRCE
jgi:spectinomycin phosphotransferase